MSLLSGIFSNDAVKKLAFSSLRKIMKDENLNSILITSNDQNREGILPGFDIQVFKNPVIVFDASIIGVTKDQWDFIQDTFKMCEGFKEAIPDAYEAYTQLILQTSTQKENDNIARISDSDNDSSVSS